jgi:hypothetical protein
MITQVVNDILEGSKTQFKKEIKEKDTISIPNIKKKFFVLEVLDDNRLKIANPEQIHFEKFEEKF